MATPEQRVGKRAEQKRRWDRENRNPCIDCGALGWTGARCVPCEMQRRTRQHDELLARVEAMWNDGLPLRAMAEALGRGGGAKAVGQELHELRKAGRIGYRYKAYERKAAT